MKWKTALTAEEAALFAVGLENFSKLSEARSALASSEDGFLGGTTYTIGEIEDGLVDPNKDADDLSRFSCSSRDIRLSAASAFSGF